MNQLVILHALLAVTIAGVLLGVNWGSWRYDEKTEFGRSCLELLGRGVAIIALIFALLYDMLSTPGLP